METAREKMAKEKTVKGVKEVLDGLAKGIAELEKEVTKELDKATEQVKKDMEEAERQRLDLLIRFFA